MASRTHYVADSSGAAGAAKDLYQVQHITGFDGAAKKYRGIGDALKIIYKEEGFRGFYKGNGTNCIRVFPYVGNAVFML